MKYRIVSMGFLVAIVGGCGVQPAALLVGDVSGGLDIGVAGTVDTDLDVEVNASFQADVICTIVCDLNTDECETVCDLADGTPATPEALGGATYLANCAACHGNPPGSGFAPDLTGETVGDILGEFGDPEHPGGAFPGLMPVDADNLAAYFASL